MSDVTLKVHDRMELLSEQDQELLNRAKDNQRLAYAPYSRFLVGAALITESGNIADGANQENASYPLCMCGERVALYNATMQLPNERIETIAIVVHGSMPMHSPAPPCGACLQVINEYETRQGAPIRLLLKSDGDAVWEVTSVRTLLPYSFDGTYLGK